MGQPNGIETERKYNKMKYGKYSVKIINMSLFSFYVYFSMFVVDSQMSNIIPAFNVS